MILRSDKCRNDVGLWSQAGGKIDTESEPSESIIQANIIREIKEELSVDISLADYLTTSVCQDDNTQWIAYSYLARITYGTPTLMEPDKHIAIEWFDVNNLPENTNQVTKESVSAYLHLQP